MIRVLIVDDHAVVRQGLKALLREDPGIGAVGEAATAGEALDLLHQQSWDVVVVDISLGEQSGLELMRQILAVRPKLPVLVLSMHPAEQYAVRVLRAGAAGYIEKGCAPEELIEAVLVAAAGKRYVSGKVAEMLAIELVSDGAEPHERLSDREHQVFLLLASGRAVSQIAEDLHVSVKTVSTHRARILDKMQLRNNAELMQYAIRRGLV